MTHAERLLLGPGPSNPYPEVMEAFPRPVLGHLDPDFLAVLDEIARSAAPRVPDREHAHAADQRHWFGRHGGVLRQPGRARRHRDHRRERRVRRAHVRSRAPLRCARSCASTRRGAARSTRSSCSTRSAAHPDARVARRRARRDVDRRRERHRAAGRDPRHRHAAARRHGHVARRHSGRGRRVGDRRGVLGHAEVSRRAARPLARELLRTRGRADSQSRESAAVVVSRPRPHRRLRR